MAIQRFPQMHGRPTRRTRGRWTSHHPSLLERSEVDIVLVGDTYGEVCLGHATTLPVTVEHLVTVTAAVRRGAPSKFLIGDMPYLSYQVNHEEAVRNAGKFMAQAGCDCVKVEVDRRLADTVAALSRATIPVMAHLGLKPQSIHRYGGYKCQGKTADARRSRGGVDVLGAALSAESKGAAPSGSPVSAGEAEGSRTLNLRIDSPVL